jgi:hypothetical protein
LAVDHSQRVQIDRSIKAGAVKDGNGNDIEKMMKADSKLNWFVVTIKIITGQEPIEYYDEWLYYYQEYYYAAKTMEKKHVQY